jgi:death-on-curing protein
MDRGNIAIPTLDDLIAIHDLALALDGGVPGVKDKTLLESAIGRVGAELDYGDDSLASCAATLAYGIARNHGFNDVNKRTAFIGMASFIEQNGMRFRCEENEQVEVFCALAQGCIEKTQLKAWIEAHISEPEKQMTAALGSTMASGQFAVRARQWREARTFYAEHEAHLGNSTPH